MMLGVMIVPVGAIVGNRKAMRALLLPGQRQVHTSDESTRRRRRLLDVVADLDGHSIVYAIRRPPSVNRVEARRLLLTNAARELAGRTVTSWTLDAQHDHQAAIDRVTIDRALRHVGSPLSYDHRPAVSEPMLWAIDAIVWACGAGGDWRRRIDQVIEVRAVTP